jgi:2',3'-cyclic-nucleotide 2'-phosphodiesterase/3'-nucleotidase/5'-nucleotidase
MRKLQFALVTVAVSGLITLAYASGITPQAPMMRGDTASTSNGWGVKSVFTVSQTIRGYQPPGILDGLGAFSSGKGKVRILANHELNPGNGYAYTLKNGTQLTGARVSFFDIDRKTLKVRKAGLAYDTVYDRAGKKVSDPSQINETGNAVDGFARLCSARGVAAGEFGFEDDIFFTGEETSKPFHPHGGTEWALDVKRKDIWAVPAMGRAAWENVTPLETGTADQVGILGGDDVESAPLYLYVGQKNTKRNAGFLDRNGLKEGSVYCWAADNGDLDPEDFNGFNESRSGTFVEMTVQDPAMAGQPGYDSAGYLDGDTLRAQADDLGCFSFSRPEDLHNDPNDPTRAVFASTGRGGLFPSDNWGAVYVVSVDFDSLTAELTILHDADDLPVPDQGVRSPDNLTWADDGFIYVQEDRSTSPSSLFGAVNGVEASIWKISPTTGDYVRIAEIDRSVVLPADATDIGVDEVGHWESSGILDVTDLFNTKGGGTLLVGTVQAHGIRDGSIGDNPLLDEGGQLIFLSNDGRFDRKWGRDDDD